jgi:hypothetical protein
MGCGVEDPPNAKTINKKNIYIRHFDSQYFNNTIVEAEMMFTQRRLERTRVILFSKRTGQI